MRGLALAVGAATALAACDADREDFISPIGDVILDFAIEQAPSGFPSGAVTIDELALGGVDVNRGDDTFDRAGDFSTQAASFFTCGGDCPAFEYVALGVSDDPRTPTMSDPDVLAQMAITPESLFAVPLFVGSFDNLAPATTYFVALERLATQVNGIPDVAAVLLSDPAEFGDFATDPASDPDDDLVSLGGAGGLSFGDNPYVITSFVTDATGGAFVAPAFGNGGTGDDYQDTNVADGMGLTANEYNFLTVYEGDPLMGGVPVVRAQIGQEVTPTNEPIGAAFAPFPTSPTTLAAVSSSACCALTASEVTLTVSSAAELTGVYQVWLINTVTGELAAAIGDYEATIPGDTGDVVVDSGMGVSTFQGGDDRTIRFTISDATQGSSVGAFTHSFVSIEGSQATVPSESQPLWAQFIEVDEADPANAFEFSFNTPAVLDFGTFNTGEGPVAFGFSGFGRGAFTGEEFGVADLFRARYRNLSLPPVGYFYEGFFQRVEDGEIAADVSIGDLTTEFAEGFLSLRDVDVDQTISTQISPTTIIESAHRATVGDVSAPFETFDEFRLRLRPKAAATATGGATFLLGTVPEPLKAREGAE